MTSYTASITRLVELLTIDTGFGQDARQPGNHFTIDEFKSLYLIVYPCDVERLFARNDTSTLRQIIAVHLGLDPHEVTGDIRRNRKV